MSDHPHEQWLWVDSDPDVRPGMLLSDRIAFYANLGMIEPFDPEHLKGASYGLALGDLCYVNGTYSFVRNMAEQTLVIRPNSFVIVTIAERVRLPFYIAGRFNLKIDMIYQGLLLGTGPQVDPGFQGKLSCPLHNICNRSIRIKLGATFATIDFVKTTPFAHEGDFRKPFEDVASLRELRELHASRQLPGYKGMQLKLIKEEKLAREDIHDYLREATGADRTEVVSSVEEIRQDVQDARSVATAVKRRVDRYVWFERAMDLATILFVVGVVFFANYFFWGRYNEAVAIANEARQIVQPIAAGFEDRLDHMERKVEGLASHLTEPTIPVGGDTD